MAIRTGRPVVDGGGEGAPAPKPTAKPATTPQQEAALVAQVVAAAIVKTPVVVDTPANVAPNRTEVENIAREIAAVIAPVIAPNLPPATVNSIVQQTTQAIVTNPKIKASDAGQSVTPAVVNNIVQTAVASKGGSADAAYDRKTGAVSTTPAQASGAGESGTIGATRIETQREADLQEALNAAKGNKSSADAKASGSSPSALAAQEGGAIGAASIEAQRKAIANAAARAEADKVAADKIAAQKATDAKADADAKAAAEAADAEERNRVEAKLEPTPTPSSLKGPGDFRKFDETDTGFTEPVEPFKDKDPDKDPDKKLVVEPTKYTATDGTVFTDQQAYVAYQQILSDKKLADDATSAANAANRQSAYDLLYAEFSRYGLGALVEPLRGLIQSGASPSEFALKLRESEPYKKRFAGNQQRISKGLRAISEAEYIGLEDQYQSILRNAGLPESYWKQSVDPTTGIVSQEGFTNFIGNDVSAVELEDRVLTAQQRLIYANPEVSIALKTFYPDITNGDLLAYALDPTKGLEQIKRRITAAEVGSSAAQMGLATNVTDAEYLARYGVNKAQAQQGYRTAAEILPTASKLGDIYSKQGLGAYTQQTAEQEIFNVPGAADAAAKRRKLSELEQASFSGRSGMGALARERAGSF